MQRFLRKLRRMLLLRRLSLMMEPGAARRPKPVPFPLRKGKKKKKSASLASPPPPTPSLW